jgi:hypothetical protein
MWVREISYFRCYYPFHNFDTNKKFYEIFSSNISLYAAMLGVARMDNNAN